MGMQLEREVPVAAAILAAVEPGFQPGGRRIHSECSTLIRKRSR